jgi:5-formyltetrahydrofolate cyclo-ligase
VSEPIAASKTRLRARVRERLAGVPVAERHAKSERIVERLEALAEVRRAAHLLLHRSLPSEVNLEALLAAALARGQRVLAPRIDGPRLRFVPIDYDTSWRRSTLGVLEPESGAAADPAELFGDRGESVAVVPGLAFDERGGRLGRGGGHYDRFLREARRAGPILAIGVGFDLQIVARVPRADHDEPVDRIVTESRVIDSRVAR